MGSAKISTRDVDLKWSEFINELETISKVNSNQSKISSWVNKFEEIEREFLNKLLMISNEFKMCS